MNGGARIKLREYYKIWSSSLEELELPEWDLATVLKRSKIVFALPCSLISRFFFFSLIKFCLSESFIIFSKTDSKTVN